MAESYIKDVDHGFKKFEKNMDQLSESFTKVGFPFDKDKKYPEGQSIASIAIDNQFGVSEKNQPPRPFFTNAFDKNKHQLNTLIEKEMQKVILDKVSIKNALTLLGEFMIGKIRKEITDLRSPKNAPMTIAMKKSSNPLIDTGRMRASVTQSVHIKGAKK